MLVTLANKRVSLYERRSHNRKRDIRSLGLGELEDLVVGGGHLERRTFAQATVDGHLEALVLEGRAHSKPR